MHKSLVIIAFTWLLTSLTIATEAQTDVSTVNVETLSDAQIKQIAQEINDRGLTPNEAADLARARGASQQQVDQMMMRLREAQLSGTTSSTAVGSNISAGEANYTPTSPGAQKKTSNASPANQRIFGYKLFNQQNLSFEPSVNIPVPGDYAIGIGDELAINVWGASQQSYFLQVDGNGAVNIPDLGPVKVAGQDFEVVRSKLINRLSAIYSGMKGSNPNTFAEVSINNLRSIKVNVIGEANNPGTYTLPATASAFNALYLSGGPNENGSFRSIRVLRDNKLVAEIDVYDYLINSNTRNNIALRDQDVIYIPTYHSHVETTGAFKRKAIFELKEGEKLADLLRFSGGFSDKASKQRLLLTRFTDKGYELEDIDNSEFATAELKNGDLIRAEEIINEFENRVSIEGAVFRPGTYALDNSMTLSDLIKKAGNLVPNYFSSRGLIIRLDDQNYPNTIPFNVNDVISGAKDIRLQKEDQVVIRDIFSMGEVKTIRIHGEIMQPGEFSFYRNMTLKDLIFMAGGMREAASESYIEIARRNSYEEAATVKDKLVSLFTFSVDRDLQLSAEDASFILKPYDQVYIRKAPTYEVQKTVTIVGEVKYPGQYSISSKEERISDLIQRAGGLTPYAFVEGARMKRSVSGELKSQLELVDQLDMQSDSTLTLIKEQAFKTLELQLPEILKKPKADNDYILKEGDEIYIPIKTKEVWVNGQVLNPTGLSFAKGKKMKYYINASGGFDSEAKKGKTYIVYANGTSASTKHFIFRKFPKVEAGAQIIVPQKPEKRRTEVTTWLAIASTLSSLAIAIAAVVR